MSEHHCEDPNCYIKAFNGRSHISEGAELVNETRERVAEQLKFARAVLDHPSTQTPKRYDATAHLVGAYERLDFVLREVFEQLADCEDAI